MTITGDDRRRWGVLVCLALVGCGAGQGEATEPGGGGDGAGGSASEREPLTLDDCRGMRGPFRPCHWALESNHYCGGPAPPPDWDDGPVCRCHECLEDADCGARRDARCLLLSSAVHPCGDALRVCVRSGESCHPETDPCPEGEECHYDGRHNPVCSAMLPPPP